MTTVAKEKFSYSVPEAAAALGVSTDTVEREIKAGRLAVGYIRSKRIIPAAALEQLVQQAPAEPRRTA